MRCATHWNIAFRSCVTFCKLIRTNDRCVYNIIYNIMIKQSSSTIKRCFFVGFICLFVCLFVCLFLFLYFAFLKQFKYVRTNIVFIMINIVYEYTLIYDICIIQSIVVWNIFILLLLVYHYNAEFRIHYIILLQYNA